MAGRLEGKVVVITGTGGGGSGRAAALRFAREGARVVGCDVVADGAQETLDAVVAAGGSMVSLHPCDLAEADQAAALIARAVDAYGGIDVLYNNAATGHFAPVGEMTFAQFQYTMDRLVTIVFHVVHAAWPHLVAGGGAIITTASVGGMRASKGNGALALAAGKGGIIAMTRQLASEGGPHGIRANSISPGFVETPVTRELLGNEEFRDAVEEKLMLGRWGQPEDIANAALFLASDEASWITGTNLVVDGGARLMVIVPEVRAALDDGAPVVALESALVVLGFPPGERAAAARAFEDAVRAGGAVPATVACLDGAIHVGLDEAALVTLTNAEHFEKVSLGALPSCLARRATGVTTVASTATIAARAGIGVFATGGIGGVHHGAAESFDISADLMVLAREPIVVVCGGVKSILDVDATLEALETLGVPVVGYGTDRFPGFYVAETDHAIEALDAAGVAAVRRAQRELSGGGMVVACRPPDAGAIPRELHDAALAAAREAAREQGVRGADVSPFLLRALFAATGGATQDAGRAVTDAAVRAGAAIAVALAA